MVRTDSGIDRSSPMKWASHNRPTYPPIEIQFSLLAGFFKYIFSKTEVHVLILGLDHAGKTVRPLAHA